MQRSGTDSGFIVGVDEAGRGPLAGPVIAAAVILRPGHSIAGIADSKTLTEEVRERLYKRICCEALAVGVGQAEVVEIDQLNILQATLLAMQRAVEQLNHPFERVLIDGNRCPNWAFKSEAIVGGDGLIPAISAASIVAKVVRDRAMRELDRVYPGYGFARHKGYPTLEHRQALCRLGACPIHRRSYAPIREILVKS